MYTLTYIDAKIGGNGPSSDAGWGCMLRCGQMILAQALVCRHLGRGKNLEHDTVNHLLFV